MVVGTYIASTYKVPSRSTYLEVSTVYGVLPLKCDVNEVGSG